MDKSLICEDNAMIFPWTFANWAVVCCTWEVSTVNIWSTLSKRRSSLLGPRAGAEEDGYAEVSGAKVNLSISSSVSPP